MVAATVGYQGTPGGPSDPATPGPYCLARCYCRTCPQYRQQHDAAARAAEHAARQRIANEGREPHRRGRGRKGSRAPVDAPRADVGQAHPPESVQAAARALRGSGTLRAEVLGLVAARGARGATSDEVEQRLGRAHQSISACLYGLEQDGLAERSGPVRATRYANDARAYLVTAHGLAELRRVGAEHPGEW